MEIDSFEQEGVLCVRLAGDDSLDYLSARAVRDDVLGRIGRDVDVVVDLSDIEFIDSAGLGVLVTVFKTVRSSGRRALFAGAREGVQGVMEIIHLDRILEMQPDVASAIRTLRESSSG